MPLIRRFDTRHQPPEEIAAALGRSRRLGAGPEREQVCRIVAEVAARGDEAVAEYTWRFDKARLAPGEFAVPAAELDSALAGLPAALRAALELAAARIREFEERQLAPPPPPPAEPGREVSLREHPLARAGIYVPGGSAAYPSSVLMNALPARVAGVGQVFVCTPPGPQGRVPAAILAACRLAGVDRVFRAGGAQAVAALAFGTASIPPVDKIAGPGNLYVTLAKREVFGVVDIDLVAGPSEVLILADAAADAQLVAADLLAQAEHDPLALAVLASEQGALLDRVERLLELELAAASRQAIARQALAGQGALVRTGSRAETIALARALAPEHLAIVAAGAEELAALIPEAGAVFLGPHSPVALGDYLAGCSHTLPTGGAARFHSGLSARAFRRRSSLVRYSAAALAADAPALLALAEAEGLAAHARSVRLRLEREAGR